MMLEEGFGLELNRIVYAGGHINNVLYLLPITAHALYVIINDEQKRGRTEAFVYTQSVMHIMWHQ